MKRILTTLCIAAAVLLPLAVSCGGDEEETGKFTVKFELGYDNAPAAPGSVTVNKNKSLGGKLPVPTRDGYEFAGWHTKDDGSKYGENTLIRSNITLKANWALPASPADAALFADVVLTSSLKEYKFGNPIMTQNFGADPNVLEWEGRLYVYMTADSTTSTNLPPAGQNTSGNDYGYIRSLRVLSTEDMVNWTQHPELKREEIPNNSWISNTWAPAFAIKEIDGVKKIFCYFSNSGGGTGVISAEHPLGPWSSPRSTNLITTSTPNSSGISPFDPAVLVDDDGKAYLYYGGSTPQGGSLNDYSTRHPDPKNIRAVQLTDNMTDIVGTPVLVDLPFSFEASEINKINGKYVYSYSSNPQVNHYAGDPQGRFPDAVIIGDSFAIAYAISDEPLGPFTFTGSVLHNPGKMFDAPYNNNHHKIFQYKNEWYIAYHTKLLMIANPPTNSPAGSSNPLDFNYRSTNIDKVNIKSNGRIDLVTGTREGVDQVGSFDPFRLIDASTIAVMGGIITEEYTLDSVKRLRVTEINTGDWIAVKGAGFGAQGAAKFWCRVTPPASGQGAIQIREGGHQGRAIGYVNISAGSESTTIEIDLLQKTLGKTDIVFVFSGTGYKLEQWQFK